MNFHDRRKNDADLASIARMLAGLDRENDMQAEAIDDARRETLQAQATVAGLTVERDRFETALKVCEGANRWLHDEVDRLTAEHGEASLRLSVALDGVEGLKAEARDLRFQCEAGKIVGKAFIRALWKAEDARDAAVAEAERAATLVNLVEASRDEAREQRDDCQHALFKAAHALGLAGWERCEGGAGWKPKLGERPDFDTIDKLRDQLHEERAEAERVVADLKTRLAGSDAEAVRLHEENDQLRQDGAELFAAVARVYVGADPRSMKRREIADILGEFIPADSGPVLKPWRDPSAPILPEEIIENAETAIPAGFVEIDLAELPDDLAARIRADAPEGSAFVEINAADLPESVFRRIYALPPEGTVPVMVAEQAAAPEVEGVE